jgi:glycosyltransferase involved in cell wall biosynthesis
VSLTPQYHSPSRLRLWRASRSFSSIPVISISNAQRWPVPQANFVRTIYHGLPEQLLMPQPVAPNYLAVLGRIAPEKGVDHAIKIARRCGIPLKIAAKVDRANQGYYDEIIRRCWTTR